jgi:hypothetical protein
VQPYIQGAERTKNGVGVGQGAAGVLSGLRKIINQNLNGSDARNREGGGGGGGGGDGSGGGGGGGGPEGVGEGNTRQGVSMSMPPT